MKNRFKLLFAATAFGLLAAGCSQDGDGKTQSPASGDKSSIRLTISSIQNSTPVMRGSTTTEDATTAELTVDPTEGLKVYVFNADGSLDYSSDEANSGPLALTAAGVANTYTSDPFEVTAGDKYFFVFANDKTAGLVTAPHSSMETFMREVIAVTGSGATSGTTDPMNIAQDGKFLLGTLWATTVTANSGGTVATPVNVVLDPIGRLASKVVLTSISNTYKGTGLAGEFTTTSGQFRIGTLPLSIFTVGVPTDFTKTTPVNVNNVLMESAVHNTPAVNTTTNAFDATVYVQYSDWQAPGTTTFFYTAENTTALDASGLQYFGNTSYVQIQTVYTPDATELNDPTDLESAAVPSLDGNTFWTANLISTGDRLIFATVPTAGTADADIDLNTVKEYAGGVNYHKFAIFDSTETDVVARNRVLRNHYYEFTITGINDLGDPTADVDPTEPIPSKTTIQVEVLVGNWNKVAESFDIG